ncbi:RHS repeat-associated core domain-containing protein [Mesoterricola silvestris]|uniref:Teneurin-like YD-shell domain-containing protein n=1 Tax=Mesoterricola silvestris TaxID=2927979 RepID=A0AA48KBY1_9BACT|nr:RHS repeat-associated core domain-containing protein [Mesoterricola silvestris]BDU72953.1 hypothetical protein METEAL_21270 [Mesoterricola silvestris]
MVPLVTNGAAPSGATVAYVFINVGPCNPGAQGVFEGLAFWRGNSADPTRPVWKKDIAYLGSKEIGEISSDGSSQISICDHLGSPRYVWDGISSPTQQKFLPYGEALADSATSGKFAKGFTNHEQTDPSGLIYMQARFYAPWYGRFLSPDPARDQHFEETQSWNIYSYVQNNPTMNIDPNGQWRTGIHNKIISKAFEGRYSSEQIKIIQNASRDFDLGKGAISTRYPNSQDPANSPWHSMTPGGGDPSDAKASRDAFVEQTIDQAAQLRFASENATGDEKTNLENQALELVGIAQHPVADETSPSHEGFQKWAGVQDVVTAVKGAAHVGKELFISKKRLEEAAKRVKAVDGRVNKKVEDLRKKEEEKRKPAN